MAITYNTFGSVNYVVTHHQTSNTTLLDGALSSSATTITGDDFSTFSASGYAQIEDELVKYTGKTATTLTGVTRGLVTPKVAHADNTPINEVTVNEIAGATTAFDYFDDTIAAGDAIYFTRYGNPFDDIKVTVGTAVAATDLVLIWEYYAVNHTPPYSTKNYPTWEELTVTDNTNGFTTLGQNTVEFVPPMDWWTGYSTGYQAKPSARGDLCWMRCRVVSVTASTEGGANATNAVQAGNNTIVVTGYSSSTRGDWQDIEDASVAGGWGVVNHTGFSLFKYDVAAQVQFGDGSTGCYFYHPEEIVEFGYNRGVKVRSDADIVWRGTLPSSYTKGLRGHPIIILHGGYTSSNQCFNIDDGATVEINCLFLCIHYEDHKIPSISFGEADVDNMIVAHGVAQNWDEQSMGTYSQSAGGSLTNVFFNNARGFSLQGTNSNIIFNTAASYDSYVGNGVTIEGIKMGSGVVWARFYSDLTSGSTGIIRNIDPNATQINTLSRHHWYKNNNFYNQYSLDLKVVDNNGDPIEGVSVAITDVNGDAISGSPFTTDASGDITSQWLTQYHVYNTVSQSSWNTPDTADTLTPHTVTISKTGYATRVVKYTMDETRTEIEKLTEDGTNIYDATLQDTTVY